MIIYLSGETAAGKPEKVLGGTANIMLTYYLIRRKHGKISSRFLDLYKFRKGKNRGKGA